MIALGTPYYYGNEKIKKVILIKHSRGFGDLVQFFIWHFYT